MSSLIPLFVIFPLGAAFLIPILGRLIKGFQKTIASLVLLFLVGLTVYFIAHPAGASAYSFVVGGWEPIDNIPIGIYFVMDGLSVLLLLIINVVGFLSAFYAISYLKKFTSENYFYTLFCLMVAGMNGVVLAGDLFNLYVFLEIAAISSYALVSFGIGKEELEASFKYQVLGGIASLLILLSIGLLYWTTGTLNIADISNVLRSGDHRNLVSFIQMILIAGFGLKAAMIPFHAWLPDAHSSAPSPISAMLSGVLIKAIGVYAILRLFFNMFAISYEVSLVITVIGTLSMLVGVMLAIGQWDIKRLLAYHSISQMGYVVLGVGIGMLILARDGDKAIAALSILGGLFHLINHAVFKGLLFLNAGAVEHETGTRDMKQLGGLAKRMPVTYSSSLAASMAISGVPPFNGFFSKLIIIVAAVQARYYLLAVLAVFVSIITLASFLKVQRFTFFDKKEDPWGKKGKPDVKEAPFTMCFSMVVLAVLCVLISLLILPGVREIILQPAVDALFNTVGYSNIVLGY